MFNAEQQPHLTFNWDQSRTTLDGRTVRGTYGHYSWRQFGTQGDVHDEQPRVSSCRTPGRVNNRLTINLGVRVEKEEVPSYVEGLNGIEFGFADKFAPRVGVRLRS